MDAVGLHRIGHGPGSDGRVVQLRRGRGEAAVGLTASHEQLPIGQQRCCLAATSDLQRRGIGKGGGDRIPAYQ